MKGECCDLFISTFKVNLLFNKSPINQYKGKESRGDEFVMGDAAGWAGRCLLGEKQINFTIHWLPLKIIQQRIQPEIDIGCHQPDQAQDTDKIISISLHISSLNVGLSLRLIIYICQSSKTSTLMYLSNCIRAYVVLSLLSELLDIKCEHQIH